MPTPITAASGDSKLLEQPKEHLIPDYSTDEIKYLGRLQAILENARSQRDSAHDELDGLTFVENWQAEEKAANTFIQPKVNEADTQFQSGIVHDSLIDLVSQVANMDMSSDIHAYDENQFEITGLGKAMETIVQKYNYLDNDDEKQIQRAYELFKHGYYFIEETWEERWQWGKKWIKKFEGIIKDAKWSKKLKKLYSRPVRRMLSGLLVYLGDITQWDFNQQSVVFTVRYRDYADAEAEYGRKDKDGQYVWERWKYVSKVRQDIAANLGPQIVYNTRRLTDVAQNQVEEIRVQFKFANEYAIILNGVLMTPVGMPLPWGYDDYNVVQQNLEPVHPFWAYGGSLVKRMKTNTAIYDELLKVGVLKTQKSLMPARANLTGRAVTRRTFMPGKITDGINPAQIPTFDQKETEGVTESELAMVQRIQDNIQKKTMPPAVAQGKETNAQVAAQQQAAKVAVGWFIFFFALGEQKLTWLRLFTVLQNHFEPTDKALDPVKNEIAKTFRITNQQTMISGKGQGNRMVIPSEENITGQHVADFEADMQQKTGTPHEVIVLKPSELKKAQYIWEVTCTPKQKKTSDVEKVLIRGMIEDLKAFPNTNWEYVEEEYAAAWGKDPAKMFNSQQQSGGQPGQPGGQSGQSGAQPTDQMGKKNIAGMPKPEKGLTQTIKNQMS
jgi:hypothetical protein